MQAIIFGGFFLHIFLENIYYCGENKWVMSQVISPMYVNTTYTFFIITPNTKQQSLPEMHFVKCTLQRDNFVLNLIAQKYLVPLSYYNNNT